MKHFGKKLLAALLAVTLLSGLAALPAAAAEDVSTFSDVSDPAVGEAVETLRIMGVISGAGGNRYYPEGSLTRAEFCKMAVLVMGRGDDVASYEARTIFTDVASSHWARGYVNLASQTEVDKTRLISGMGQGLFLPDAPISYDQAVTILLRMLGYGSRIESIWPADARALAAKLDLNAGLGAFTGGGPITRAQAALLFRNLLLTPTASGEIYAGSLGKINENDILVSVGGRAGDGSPAVTLSSGSGPVKPAANLPASFMVGKRGISVLDSSGRFLTFIPERGGSSRTVTVELAAPTSITGTDGTKLAIPSDAKVVRDGEEAVYGQVYPGIRAGLVVTVYYTVSGAVDFVYVTGRTAAEAGKPMIAEISGASAFDDITGGSRTCTVLRNGSLASLADLRSYDVGMYSAGSDTLYVSDFRMTCVYSDAWPNVLAPTKVTLMGHEFELLESARAGLEDVKLGALVTALFTPDGRVAALLPMNTVRATAMGFIHPGAEGQEVTIDLINAPDGLTSVSGTLTSSFKPELFESWPVFFNTGLERRAGGDEEILYITRDTGAGSGELDLSARTVGGAAIASGALIYERVGTSGLTPISLADITAASVPAGKVAYTHRNNGGKVDILILDDVTGDRYVYGLIRNEIRQTDSFGGGAVSNNVITVLYGEGEDDRVEVVGSAVMPNGSFGGVAVSKDSVGSYKGCAAIASMTEIASVSQACFNASALRFVRGDVELAIAPDVKCYNAATGKWFSSLTECLMSSNSFSVWYDRSPETGGKIRIIVAN